MPGNHLTLLSRGSHGQGYQHLDKDTDTTLSPYSFRLHVFTTDLAGPATTHLFVLLTPEVPYFNLSSRPNRSRPV